MDSLEKNLILQALQKTQGNKQRTANLLKINLRSLRYRMLKHGMERNKKRFKVQGLRFKE